MRKEVLVDELLLVLLPDMVMGFILPHYMLQEHYHQAVHDFCVGEFAIANSGDDFCAKDM